MSNYNQPAPDSDYERMPRQPRKRSWVGWATLICSILALVLSATALYFVLSKPEEVEPEPPATIQYRDLTLPVLDGVPVNRYDSAGFTTDGAGRISYEQDGVRAKTGIDVSVYQGEIDWAAVAADGVDFAMIRLGYRGYTEGALQMDSMFQANIQGALDAGLEVGVYFFSQSITPEEALQEAAFVLAVIEQYDVTYPVAFDWEFITPNQGARTDGIDGQVLSQCAVAFCQRVAQAGYTPTVYFNQDLAYLTYDLSQLVEFPLWLAEYDSDPDFYYDFALWQYTHTGSVDGIQGDVDWNLDFKPIQTKK